ncbi:hypothetical protein V3C99_017561 [Haemonchus contortus]
MRRVAGVHMRASRHRIVALTNQEGRRLAPSLRSAYRRGQMKSSGDKPGPITTVTTNTTIIVSTDTSKAPTPRFKK